MAAVSVPSPSHAPHTMTTRRVPLANVPNATNSPYRPPAAAAAKRPRPHAQDQRDFIYGQGPPNKKQIVEEGDADHRRHALLKRAGYSHPTALQKKLEAVRDGKSAQKPVDKSHNKAVQDNYETIRQWQKHYRKVFPHYVFYFESIPAEARSKAVRQLLYLGAREEKFFSKDVTHVITTRPIPPEQSVSSSVDLRATPSNAITSPESKGEVRTINPSLLNRSNDQHAQRSRLGLDLTAQRKSGISTTQGLFQDVETRRHASSGDILVKAREMGMKIWALEKLDRILNTMFNTDTGEQPHAHNTRGNAALAAKANKGADLSQLLRNEKVNGPADRDLGVATKDMAHFRAYYVYVHCMNEKYRPVIVREYPRVPTKEEGKWPQFRLTGPGRCPFVEDPAHVRKLQMEQQKPSQPKTERAVSAAPRTRAASAALEAARMRGAAPKAEERPPLEENDSVSRRRISNTEQSTDMVSKPLDPPKLIPAKRSNTADSMPPLFDSAQAGLRSAPRFVGGEPVASGVQPSNVTSAIRSQMISSTAAAPGARGNTSKELQNLSRKVLEKNSAPNSMNSSYLAEVRAALNGDRTTLPRAAKRKAQETLTNIHEDSEEEHNPRRVVVPRKNKPVERDPKPGYCENCREKFDDFEIHTVSRKHRKFALTPDNWTELDALLNQLERPVL
ncbi:uncharacterized protein K452DRAFT_157755 [Aplosporella prunicola CBS 121167]|uniref:DBF4-type domain-containing protein n=1 Tax=Aplosporella prunicola CBS 121167 TaxID=1176127 RepID=A0A6A6AW14_9PEZI|nr:uncharacterized protein K452DRAFT_157755 [Aplosporella prunicola CBS 121167]KAF2135890.1 hypothetical protein K452DRAFT_157755 [Aplosporella prunicola CBS 121167]